MRWQLGRRSSNVEDRRGAGGLALGGLSGGAVVLALLGSWVLGIDPMQLLGVMVQMSGDLPVEQRGGAPPADDPRAEFARAILGDTEDTWTAIFEARGGQYEHPRLVLFSGMVRSDCGGASSATGPFYCPLDRHVYLDFSFFEQMKAKLGGGGDFAEAYVIAHEVGHHVQTLLGVTGRVDAARRSGENVEGAEGLLVRQELQADCLAGLWAYHAQKRHGWLEEGDIEEALGTASAIGDDRLQRQSGGTVVPDAFTHGTSEQRVAWFKRGFESGDLARCDTFAGGAL